MLTGHEIRRGFLDFFASHDHRVVRSSSLVPAGDPTLLFTNAGMNQFKDVFLGLEQREYKRATSVQKCVRAGGKHNDLENVGFTNRHHTFFEMLGNFSFGDYFKKEAIAFAWEFIVAPQYLAIPLHKLYFTVFGGAEIAGVKLATDEEATELWVKVGAPRDRIIAIPGLKENFWAMGDTGPCGPCSEIHFDMGPLASSEGHTNCKFGCECGRYMEIWNLVFMQFNRDTSGTLAPLPNPSIDTGAGLERIAAVMLNLQDPAKVSNYDTDLFVPLIELAAKLTGVEAQQRDDSVRPSLRIIADHARAATFLISDGVVPSNDGRGYVLRKILRRGIRHGRLLGATQPFMADMAQGVREAMSDAYPELDGTIERVAKVILAEETRFAHTIEVGLEKLEEELAPYLKEQHGLEEVTKGTRQAITFPGEKAFKLYDTYGLPLDFITDVLRDQGVSFEPEEFDRAMEEQRTRARASWKGGHKEIASPAYAKLAETFHTEPDFYFVTHAKDLRIEAIITAQGAVNELAAGAEGELVFDRTPFYAESGGQQSDIGTLWNNERTMELATVRGAYHPLSGLVAHRVIAKETVHVGDRVYGEADAARRERIKRNHSATHLMHAALRSILGTHVKQAGSQVAPERLRFDFSHFATVDAAELLDIEQMVNDQIRQNSEITTDVTTLDDALSSGALAFFGDRYPEQNVRVVTVVDANMPRGFYSKELCGGTHVKRAGDVGVFKVAVEQSIAAGVRRIEALTGEGALANYQKSRQILESAAAQLHVGEDQIGEAIARLVQSEKQMEKQLEALKKKAAVSKLDELLEKVRTVKDVRVLSAEMDGIGREGLRQLVDPVRQKMGSGIVVLGSIDDGKVALIASVTNDLTKRVQAGKIIQALAKEVGGQGGGRPDLAEAGGKDTSKLKSTLDQVYSLLEQLL